jgi:hypothetical protein
MQDEHLTRQWNSDHDRFSADLDRGLGHIVRFFKERRGDEKSIGSSYGFLAKYEQPKPAGPVLSPAAEASLRGLAASVITFALWVTVMLVATPAPGLAAPLDAPAVQAAECVAHPALA